MTTRRDEECIIEHLQVLRAQMGDRDAYARLFDRYHRRVLQYVHGLLGNFADAEDVMQEVWLTVVRKIATLEHPSAFQSWLYRIARNRGLSRLRKIRRDLPLDDVAELPDLVAVDDSADEDDGALAGYDDAAVHEGLERLSATHREALTLRFLEGLSYEEIADVIGCSVGTVRSRIHYGKNALQEQLAPRSLTTNRTERRGRNKE